MEADIVEADYATIQQAASYLGLSIHTLRRWESEGTLRTVRRPGSDQDLYKRSDLEPLRRLVTKIESDIAESDYVTIQQAASDLGVSIRTLRRWDSEGRLRSVRQLHTEHRYYNRSDLEPLRLLVSFFGRNAAGHDNRVAVLAEAIAKEMGLSEHEFNGIHFAATIHDLGQIQVPANILSKRGKLSNLEFQLVKIHVETGHDILKGIEFRWPIAQIVLQHHERLDGSGYPQGLKGAEILREARILAVADTVEAMVSDRPYRSAPGIDTALDELVNHRGKLYDADVADCCIELFRESRFTFSN